MKIKLKSLNVLGLNKNKEYIKKNCFNYSNIHPKQFKYPDYGIPDENNLEELLAGKKSSFIENPYPDSEQIEIGKKIPNFLVQKISNGVCEEIELEKELTGKYLMFFFFPSTFFTSFSETELLKLSNSIPEFSKIGILQIQKIQSFISKYELIASDCKVFGCTLDTVESQNAYLDYIKTKNTLPQIEFPVLVDHNLQLSRTFQVLAQQEERIYSQRYPNYSESII
jgi:alkyl hydroperoxide reductase subunit AhpC